MKNHEHIVTVHDGDHLKRVAVLVGTEEQHLALRARVGERHTTDRNRMPDPFRGEPMLERGRTHEDPRETTGPVTDNVRHNLTPVKDPTTPPARPAGRS